MKKICIDGVCLCNGKIAGIPRVMYEIILELDQLITGEDIEIQVCYPNQEELGLPDLKNIKKMQLTQENGRSYRKEFVRYSKKIGATECLLDNGIVKMKSSITCIHDIRALDTMKYDTWHSLVFMLRIKYFAKIFKPEILTVSQFVKNDIVKKFPYDPKHIHVIYNGWQHILRLKDDNQIFSKFPQIKKGQYYYALGSVARHKNYEWIREVAKRNPQQYFVIAGNISKEDWAIDDSKLKTDNVVLVGYVSDEENIALLKNCKAFIHPSKYEGFGIPPLEALALGKKIIISNATCLPEIYGDAAAYFDPDDYNVNLDELCMHDGSQKAKELLAKYSWHNSAIEVLNVIKSI